MKSPALLAIAGYRRFISPYKGFSCAYRIYHGGPSCSALGYRAIRRYGILEGLAIIGKRLKRCGEIHRSHMLPIRVNYQQGFCDLPVCDLPSCDLPSIDASCCFDLSNAGSCDCSNPFDSRRSPKTGEEEYVDLPPDVWKK